MTLKEFFTSGTQNIWCLANSMYCGVRKYISIKIYINIIEKSGGQKPTNIAKRHTIDNDKQAVELICNSYRNHPSIIKIKSNITTKGKN